MELTPELFETVAFRERWRGYDPDEVDEFLERVGAALAGLFDQLRDAEARARDAVAATDEHREVDEAMRSMLLLAHRTAETAVAEAREQADSIVAEAHDAAAQTAEDVEAEVKARREAGIAELAAEVADLSRQRDTLLREIEVLRARRDEERELMRRELQSRLADLERPIVADPDPDPAPRGAAPSAAGVVMEPPSEPEDLDGPPTEMIDVTADGSDAQTGGDDEAVGGLDSVFDDAVGDGGSTGQRRWSELRSVPQRR